MRLEHSMPCPPPLPPLQSVASSDRDHLKQVMNKIKAKKAGERKDMDRVLRTHDGAIEGIEMSSSKKKRKK